MTTTSPEDRLKKLSDPPYVGPGTWYCIHTVAAQVTNYAGMKEAIKFIEQMIKSFKCETCRNHAVDYLIKNPIRACLDCKHTNHKGDLRRCLFEWTVSFHNAVNTRLGKPVLSSDVAYSFYESKDPICNANCGEKEEPPQAAAMKVTEKNAGTGVTTFRIVPRY